LGCFQVEPRAEILHQKRQSVPLPPPINRFYLHALEVEKIWSKVSHKTSHFQFQQHFPPFLLSPPCLQPLKPPQTLFSSTNRWCSIHTNSNPHRWQNSHRDRRAFLLYNFSSSVTSNRHQPLLPPPKLIPLIFCKCSS